MCRPTRYVPRPLLAETFLARIQGTRGFLEAIAEEPWNDGLRLILADYLEDQGYEARARFIRLQVRRQSVPECTAPWTTWRREEQALFETHRATWVDGVPTNPSMALFEGFAGGVLELLPTVSVDLADVLTRLSQRIDVRRAWLLGMARQEPLTLDLPSARLSHLRVHQPEDAQVEQLADTPHLRHLVELNLCCGGMGLRGARAVGASPHLGQLSRLLFHGMHLGPDVAAVMAESNGLSGLTLLSLDSNAIGDEGAAAVAGAAHLKGLTHLFLGNNAIGPVGVDLLTGSPHLTRVSHLNLSGNRLDAEAVMALVTWPHAGRLTYLDLSNNPIGDDGADLLADADGLDNLTLLCLFDCDLSEESRTRLRERYGDRVWLNEPPAAA